MGNSQTTGIEKLERNAAEAGLTSPSTTTFGGSIRSRRGSKVKVFGLLGQKKSPKEPTTPTTPTATVTEGLPQNVASTTSSATRAIGRISSIDEETEAELHHKHDAVVRQLEFQQMEIRAKQTAQKSNKSKLFSRKLFSNDNVKSYRTEKGSMHKKRPAPKPPSAINAINISQTTTDKLKESIADEKPQNGNDTKNDHRVFIENLFDSTLQLQPPSCETVENKSVSSKIKGKPMTTTSTPHKKDNDKTNTTTKDPLTPPQSTTSATAPVDCSTAEPCSTTFDDIDDVDDDLCDVEDDDNDAETNSDEYEHKSNQTHTEKTFCTPTSATQLPISLKELTANTTLISRATAAAVTGKEQKQQQQNQHQHQQRRPLSDISITSVDTSGILSPTTAKAIVELQKRHQADKLSLLSVAKTTYLELLPADTTATQTESSPELETESPDEQMALHLGKKLAQVLSGNSSNAGGNGGNAHSNSGVMATASATGSSMPDNMTCCNMVTGTNELFNIAKAKKIELPSLSSRLVATATQISPAAAPPEIPDTSTGNIIASTDAKHLPTLQSQTPALPTSTSAACPTAPIPATTTPTETQSTVIISFKSSQTPVQSQPPLNITGIEQQHTPAVATPFYNDDTIIETMSYTPTTPSLVSNNNSNLTYASITAQMGSPLCTPRTPKNNVLKKVASFTLEKASGGSANKNNGDPNSGMTGQLENVGSKRSTFVPEKLSFAAYEKFEGQMLMKWFISSLQNNCNHLSEQDISMLTLQYCNNLINVGVLKQISEKNDLETFKPFQMYQWTHTEAPTTSQPLTPGKLDKVTSWPYCSTPTSGVSRIPKAIQVDTPHTGRDNGFLQVLRKRLLSCSTIAEVHIVINDMLSAGEPLRRPSKRSILLTDLLNASEATVYQYDKNVTGTSSGCESGIQDAGVQTEVSQAIVKFVCSKCKDANIDRNQYGTMKCDKEIQVSWNEVGGDTLLDSKKLTLATSEPMPPSTLPPPPPPPLAGSIVAPPPPPPPPPSLLPPPPPPPPPSSVGPPPPPPPSSSSATNTLALNTSTVPPPPPPGAIKTPSTTTPAPLPNPAEGGWFNQANTLRKTAVNPPKPMKPLYWTRIVTQPPPPKPIKVIAETSTTGDITDSSSPGTSPDDPVSSESPSVPKEIWQEIDETCLDNIDEFTELFSREAVVPKVVPKIKKEVRARPIKVLDSKRSQNVGILLRSSHVDFCEIEHAIYHVDTSVVSLETLQQINKNKATNEELERIKEQGDIPLDEPEQFLLKISQISMFTERISCMVFMAEFEETATLIERKLEVVMQLSQFLMESEELKLIFAIILTLGNYMNGGNRQRGQADGFTLEILSKLKDVKSKDSQTTLLHFIVRTYIGRKRKEGVQLLEIPLPIPEPSDVERATQVDFDEVKGQITKLNDQLNAKKRTTDKVIIHSTTENLEPFKSKMEEFIKNASKEVDKLYKELEDCREVFIETMKFYHYAPKSGTLEQCTPNKFFEHWTNFTNDFKDIMKKEIAILWNELLRKTKDVQTRKTVKTTKVKPGGLKERIMRLNKK